MKMIGNINEIIISSVIKSVNVKENIKVNTKYVFKFVKIKTEINDSAVVNIYCLIIGTIFFLTL